MDAYSLGQLFKTLLGSFGAKWTLVIILIVAIIIAAKKSIAWFTSEVVRLLGEWVKAQTEEKQMLMRQNQQYASEIQTFLHNHLAHMKAEREEHRSDLAARDLVLGEMRDSLVRIGSTAEEALAEVKAHRSEDQRRAEDRN